MTAPPQDMRGRHYARPDTYVVNVRIEHPVSGAMINYGTFDKVDGGEIDSGTKTHNPGGMVIPIALAGPKTVSNLVVTRAYRLARDHDVIQQLIDSVGRSSTIVTVQPLDADGNAYGTPITYLGILKSVTPPSPDSQSSTAALLSLEVVVEGFPSS